jgi:hypothetical protein
LAGRGLGILVEDPSAGEIDLFLFISFHGRRKEKNQYSFSARFALSNVREGVTS